MKISRGFNMFFLAGLVSSYVPGTIWAQSYTQWSFQNTTATAVQVNVFPCTGSSQGCGPCAVQVPANGTAGPFDSGANANNPCVYCVGGPQYGPSNTVYGMCNGATNWGVAGPNSGLTYNVILYPIGGGPSHSPSPGTGCITLNNNTGEPQYYTWQGFTFNADGSLAATSIMSGCSSGISVGGQSGQGNTPGQYMAIYPGESITVCSTLSVPYGGSGNLVAVRAPTDGSVFVCGGAVGDPRCVMLCTGDNVPYGGQNDTIAGESPFAGSGTATNTFNQTNGAFGQSTNVNTNNIPWPQGTSNLLIPTLQTGFSAVVGAVNQGTVAVQNGDDTIVGAINGAGNLIAGTINSNFARGIGVTNFPTNYPDKSAIGLLGTIATNTSRTNTFDTNLESSAAAIASNTAAPLAYTNLGLDAYSTNPDDVVGYASNTLAAPISQSMQAMAQTASTAGDAVNIGGSPGDLLTISFALPGGGSYTIDCNPMDNPDIADLAGWFRGLIEWIVGLGFIGMVLRDGTEATRTTFLTPQGQFPKLTVLGNSIGWPLAAVYIVAIVAAMAAVPFVIVTWFSVGATGQMWWQQIAVNPFSGAGVGRAVGLSLWLADQFLPMSYIVSSIFYYIAFRFTLNGIVTVAATIVRALMA